MGLIKGLAILIVIILSIVMISGCIGGKSCPNCGTSMDTSYRTGESGTWYVCPDCYTVIAPDNSEHQVGVSDTDNV